MALCSPFAAASVIFRKVQASIHGITVWNARRVDARSKSPRSSLGHQLGTLLTRLTGLRGQELRRGADPARIFSIAFAKGDCPEWLAMSSDKVVAQMIPTCCVCQLSSIRSGIALPADCLMLDKIPTFRVDPTDFELSQAGNGSCFQTGSRGSRRKGISCCPRCAARWKQHKPGVRAVFCQREWDSGRSCLQCLTRPGPVRVRKTERALAQLLMLTFPVMWCRTSCRYHTLRQSALLRSSKCLKRWVKCSHCRIWLYYQVNEATCNRLWTCFRCSQVANTLHSLRDVDHRSQLAQILSRLQHRCALWWVSATVLLP